MSSAAVAIRLPRAMTGGPRDGRRFGGVSRDWWLECKRILAAACPLIIWPSPLRERLPHHLREILAARHLGGPQDP